MIWKNIENLSEIILLQCDGWHVARRGQELRFKSLPFGLVGKQEKKKKQALCMNRIYLNSIKINQVQCLI